MTEEAGEQGAGSRGELRGRGAGSREQGGVRNYFKLPYLTTFPLLPCPLLLILFFDQLTPKNNLLKNRS
ncbi:MAG: hypothetical protein EA343_22485 [Nodularia sp. (in: Bacteria)]|nr:MAG: hypothetical protein EA343_22485 [Nodularia sp. (in: cyanobacteria)]